MAAATAEDRDLWPRSRAAAGRVKPRARTASPSPMARTPGPAHDGEAEEGAERRRAGGVQVAWSANRPTSRRPAAARTTSRRTGGIEAERCETSGRERRERRRVGPHRREGRSGSAVAGTPSRTAAGARSWSGRRGARRGVRPGPRGQEEREGGAEDEERRREERGGGGGRGGGARRLGARTHPVEARPRASAAAAGRRQGPRPGEPRRRCGAAGPANGGHQAESAQNASERAGTAVQGARTTRIPGRSDRAARARSPSRRGTTARHSMRRRLSATMRGDARTRRLPRRPLRLGRHPRGLRGEDLRLLRPRLLRLRIAYDQPRSSARTLPTGTPPTRRSVSPRALGGRGRPVDLLLRDRAEPAPPGARTALDGWPGGPRPGPRLERRRHARAARDRGPRPRRSLRGRRVRRRDGAPQARSRPLLLAWSGSASFPEPPRTWATARRTWRWRRRPGPSRGHSGAFPNREALAAARPDVLAPSLDEAVTGLLRRMVGPS